MVPLQCKIQLPKKTEPGSFGFVRKHDIHTGVDLYCNLHEPVYAIESGIVISCGHFTGYQESPWWNDTDFILIQGKSGCILYGEIKISPYLFRAIGDEISEGTILGEVIPVLKKDKGLPMNMLHIELYDRSYTGSGEVWKLNQPQPIPLKDITPLLKREINRKKPLFKRLLGYIAINI
jgi:hypothetical protein